MSSQEVGGRAEVALIGSARHTGEFRGAGAFDREVFGLSAADADGLDDRLRTGLEVVWTALEDARIAPDRLGRWRVGLFTLPGARPVGAAIARCVDGAQPRSGDPVSALRSNEVDLALVVAVGGDAADCGVAVLERAADARAAGRRVDRLVEPGEALTPTADRERESEATADPGDSGPALWALSAPSVSALRLQADRLRTHVEQHPGLGLRAVGAALARTRTHFPERAVLVADDREAMLAGLAAVAGGRADAGVIRGSAPETAPVVFVFPGIGPHWPGMATELLATSPIFRARLETCDAALAPIVGWSLLDVLTGAPERVGEVGVLQPVWFAVTLALAELWRSSGVEPDAVLGHSIGEVAAATFTGALSIEDGCRVAAAIGHSLRDVAREGEMAAVLLPVDQVVGYLPRWGDALVLAGVNGPNSVVVSGDTGAVAELLDEVRSAGARAQRLPLGYAAHSPHIERIRQRMTGLLAGIRPRSTGTPFYSCALGGRTDTSGMTAEYWYASLRNPFHFENTVRAVAAAGYRVLIELSHHPVVAPDAREIVDRSGTGITVLGTGHRSRPGTHQFLTSVGNAHAAGAHVDWDAFAGRGTLVDLPTYPFGSVAAEPAPEQQAAPVDLVDVIRAEAAQLLGADVPAGRTFADIGFDSLLAVRLRDRLADALGTRLPATLAFDCPTPEDIAAFLTEEPAATPATTRTTSEPVNEPIAIIGMSCRLPGGVDSPSALWRLVSDGAEVVSSAPENRGWDLAGLYAAEPGTPGRTYTLHGGFLPAADLFDPALFGISPREAAAMDPQQRLLLETSWEVFEHAGIAPDTLRGSRTGVFTGLAQQDYGPRLHEAPPELEGHLLTGGLTSVASGRIAYTFGLTGPAITIDTACSSSLVAVHLASRSLAEGESTLALAGGAMVMSGPGLFVSFAQQHGLAADGRCKPFSATADGTVWGEGVALVLLERLSDARRNGHPVLALIRGTAVNSDGTSNGLTAPNGLAQQRVIQQALAAAGLSPSDVDAVEAHGTGTELGDPIEAQALIATYGRDRAADRPLWLGSLKSNTGHTQAAAGVAGLIKMVMAMRHGVLPKTLHITEPTPHVDWSAGAVRLLTEAQPWPAADAPRRAGVSSFGISGTNAHVIVEQAPTEAATAPGAELSAAVPCMLAAQTEQGLADQARRLLEFPVAGSTADIGWSLATTRAALRHRAVVVGASREELRSGLRVLASGGSSADVVRGTAAEGGRTAFVFPGQGAHWAGMAAGLLDRSSAFTARMTACAEALRQHVDWSLIELLRQEPGAPPLDRVDVLQPAVWAVMVSLADLWESWGVQPSAVVGHSQGEVAAACVAGGLSLEDGALVVTRRAQLIGEALSGRGGMASVAASVDEVRGLITEWGGELALAVVNGPAATVVSGDAGAVGEFVTWCEGRAVRTRRLAVDYASHSGHVDVIRDELESALRSIRPVPGRIPFLSTVTGGWLDTARLDAGYWSRNLRDTVRFDLAARELAGAGLRTVVEVSPHPTLVPALRDGADDRVVVGSLRRGEPDDRQMVRSLAELAVRGARVDWAAVFGGHQPKRIELPTYAFQRQRYWARPDDTARTEDAVVDSWRYRVAWQPVRAHRGDGLSGTWLLVSARTPEATTSWVRAALSARGARVVPLLVDPGISRAQLTGLLPDEPVAGVVSTLALAEDGTLVPRGLVATVTLTQALGDAGIDAPLWCLTQEAVSTGGERLAGAAQAQVWGLGRVIGLEHPDRWGGLVDLAGALDDQAADHLVAVLTGIGAEQEFAVRPSGVSVRRLVRAERGRAVANREWRPRGSVLVTGGTGGIGAHIARWLARSGAEHLILVGRRGGAAELSAQLTDLGVRVDVVACDVSDRRALTELLDAFPVTAVFHAAGVTEPRRIAEMTEADLVNALAAKVVGARNLDELLGRRELDAFVVFSSGAGVWGSAGDGAYAAANAYLDALALRRRARDLTATSVAWGAWAGGGMVDEAVGAALGRAGIRPMPPGLAIAALRQALDFDETTVVVADLDRERFVATYRHTRPRPLVDDLAVAVDPAVGQERGDRLELADLPPGERNRVLLDLVRSATATVLGYPAPGSIDADIPFTGLGIDSLTAVELRDQLTARTGVRLPATLVFDSPTVAAVANRLRDELVPGAHERREQQVRPGGEDEPIAIIGMGCRFPGGANSPEALWRLVASGVDTVAGVPADRGWDVDPRTTGSFLTDATLFDAAFFGMSPREAIATDPQQRLVLEVAWETAERAGIDPHSLRGTRTGVFIGASAHDYGTVLSAAENGYDYLLTGAAASALSGRIAYALGLEGPALTIDTACSASLVALHTAARSLRNGECELAFAGGVTVLATSAPFVAFARQGGLAPDGRCKSFAAAADGTGWGEGAGLLVLARLSDAIRLGHRVLAVVRGSAVNSDGASNGLTAPNGPAQERVIRQALADGGLSPSDVDVVEGHGTGTVLGDPIEAQAVLATYGQDRAEPLWLGSLKSNIGHTQAAAGVGGVIKMVEAMRNGVLPRTLHAETPSSQVDWSSGNVRLLSQARPWPATGRPRRAAVSAFGVSGTNAHVIVEQYEEPPVGRAPAGRKVLPWVVSGRSAPALDDQARQLRAHLDANSALEARDVGWTLATARATWDHRAVVVGCDDDALRAGLADLSSGTGSPHVITGRARGDGLALLFPGQGSRYQGVGRGLHQAFPAFAEAFDETCEHFDGLLDRPLRDVLLDPAEAVPHTGLAQAGLFALQVALFRLVERWGLRPRLVLGHSVGELAAAHVAGVWSLADAARVVAARGRLMQALPDDGAMVAIEAAAEQIAPDLAGREHVVALAAVNGRRSVVISGRADAVRRLAGTWRARGRRVRQLNVARAFHSPLVEPVLGPFRDVLRQVRFRQPVLPVVSNVTGRIATSELSTPDYWLRHLRDTVRFADGVATLVSHGVTAALELGSDGVLSGMASQDGESLEAVAALRDGRDEAGALVTAVARMFVHGVDVDWSQLFVGSQARHVDLPTYPFQRERFWPTRSARADVSSAGLTVAGHPLLGARLADPSGERVTFTGRISPGAQPWLSGHVVLGRVLLPGTGFVELALWAAAELGHDELAELTLRAPLVLAGTVQLQVVVEGGDEVRVYSRPDGPGHEPWTLHAEGRIRAGRTTGDDTGPHLPAWPPAGARPLPLDDFYEDLADAGYRFDPPFRGLRLAWREGADRYGEVELPEDIDVDGFAVHPALLDSALHLMRAGEPAEATLLPFAWAGVRRHAAGARSMRVRLTRSGDRVSLFATDSAGHPVITVDALTLRPASAQEPDRAATALDDSLFRVAWTALELSGVHDERGSDPVLLPVPEPSGADVESVADAAALAAEHTLAVLRSVLAEQRPAAGRAVVVTRSCLAHAAVRGLVRTAQAEHPDRFTLLRVDGSETPELVAAAAGCGEPEVAIRAGRLYARRLSRAGGGVSLVPPKGRTAWSLDTVGRGSLHHLALVGRAEPELRTGQLRIAVHASGVNFRDVLVTLDRYPGDAELGIEGAGVVVETGPGVTAFTVGDRVLGLFDRAFGPTAVADQRTVVRMPDGWSFEQAATVPVAFVTAYYGLVDLAGLRPGEKVLIHAAAGGVGTAAVRLARHLGAEVFGTASPWKWAALRESGLDDEHIASSRSVEFRERFPAVDVVLNCLTGEYLDASLDLLAPGGRFLELGKTDVRDVAGRYWAFDLSDPGPERIGQILAEVTALAERNALTPLPLTTWDIRRARDAFRALSRAQITGKAVLTQRPFGASDTVLITGGTGALGGLLAHHLAVGYGLRHVVLASRRGPAAPGAEGLRRDLAELGVTVTLAACDVCDERALAQLLEPIRDRLAGVVHAAGVVDDGAVTAIDGQRLAAVLAPKVTGAWNLHRLTADLDLSMFVLFSSLSATLGNPGQANYAAANAFLDELAEYRARRGMTAVSLAWGHWQGIGMAADLTGNDAARLVRAGVLPMTAEHGLALFDAAVHAGDPVLVPARLDLTGDSALAALAGGLVRAPHRDTREAHTVEFGEALAGLPAPERRKAALDLVRGHVAVVLGYPPTHPVPLDEPFKEQGFDSLTAVELRNRLREATSIPMPPTLVFDHPTPVALAEHLLELAFPEHATPAEQVVADLDRVAVFAETIDRADPALQDITRRLRRILHHLDGVTEVSTDFSADLSDTAELLAYLDGVDPRGD